MTLGNFSARDRRAARRRAAPPIATAAWPAPCTSAATTWPARSAPTCPGWRGSGGTGPACGRWRSRPMPSGRGGARSRRGYPGPSVRSFSCSTCGQLVFFENTVCLRCGSELGFEPGRRELVTLSARRRALREPRAGRLQLAGRARRASCARAAGSRARARPTTTPRGSSASACAEAAKRWLLFELGELALPVQSWRERDGGLAFELLSSDRGPVTTGHADGVITLDVAESDDAHREALREQLGEPYRTVLGHFRHEIGHYYWPLLVPEGRRARALPRAVRRRARGLRRGARAPLRERPAARLAAALRQRLRDDAPVGGLGGDLRPLPAHPGHAADRRRLRRERARRRATRHPTAGDFRALLDDWLPLTYALNALSRSMGATTSTRSSCPRRWSRSSPSSTSGSRQHRTRVEQPVGVERALDRAIARELARRAHELEPARLGHADAVLGADRPAARGRERAAPPRRPRRRRARGRAR